MKLFKMAAKTRGYDLEYDRSLKMYALYKAGVQTEYFTSYVLTQMGLTKFYQVYLQG